MNDKWKLVPAELTPQMAKEFFGVLDPFTALSLWEKLLAAAPTPEVESVAYVDYRGDGGITWTAGHETKQGAKLYTQPRPSELASAMESIVNLDPYTDTDEGSNEWGEATCFKLAQSIASAALERVGS